MPTVAIIDRSDSVKFPDIQSVAIAIGHQVQTDLFLAWNVTGQVVALQDIGDLQTGMWPVYLVTNLPANEGGIHHDDNGQPFALVEVGETWSLAASHEICEMLVDPSGSRLHAGRAIDLDGNGDIVDAPGTYQYLVEICDPSEAHVYAYGSPDIPLSDFYLPNFFDDAPSPGASYSKTGALKAPRRVLAGGYLSWLDPTTNTMRQLNWTGNAPQILDLGSPAQASGQCLRAFVDGKTRPSHSLSTFGDHENLRERARAEASARARDTSAHSRRWLRTLDRIYGKDSA